MKKLFGFIKTNIGWILVGLLIAIIFGTIVLPLLIAMTRAFWSVALGETVIL